MNTNPLQIVLRAACPYRCALGACVARGDRLKRSFLRVLLAYVGGLSVVLTGVAYAQQDYSQTGYSQPSPYPSQTPGASPYPSQQTYPDQSGQSPSGQYPQQSYPANPSQPYPQTSYPQSGSPSQPNYPSPPQSWTPPQAPQAAPALPVPQAAQTGPCSLKLSTDRSTIYLLDAAGTMERKHLSLGSDRVQKAFTSPDGAWSVVIYKVRGVQQFGFIAVELASCEDQLPVELPSVAASATFEQGEVVLGFDKGKTQRFPLKNGRMQ